MSVGASGHGIKCNCERWPSSEAGFFLCPGGNLDPIKKTFCCLGYRNGISEKLFVMGNDSFPSAEQPRKGGGGAVWSRRGPWLCSPGPLQILITRRRPGRVMMFGVRGLLTWPPWALISSRSWSVFLADDFISSLMVLL